jgi:hypothetical protein
MLALAQADVLRLVQFDRYDPERGGSDWSVKLIAHFQLRIPKWLISELHGATRKAIAKTPAKWSAYQIPSVIVVICNSSF